MARRCPNVAPWGKANRPQGRFKGKPLLSLTQAKLPESPAICWCGKPAVRGRNETGSAAGKETREEVLLVASCGEVKRHGKEKGMKMRRVGIVAALSMFLVALSASAAFAQVAPGTYSPDAGSFDSANAPGSSHLRSGSPACTVNADLDVDCSAYVLGGVGNTNAAVSLTASYSATIDCTNRGGNLVESHTSDFSDTTTASVASTRNGQLRVPAQSTSAFDAPQVCPNPNWTPSIREGTLTLESFTYTLTFAGFDSPYITISEP
jgi:hypothetical protein